jgi:hypothetical protein
MKERGKGSKVFACFVFYAYLSLLGGYDRIERYYEVGMETTTLAKSITLTKPDDFGKLLQDEGIIFTQLDKAVNWARRSSIWLRFGAVRCGGVSPFTSASGLDDCGRAAVTENGSRY